MRIQLSFVQFSLLCYKFCISSKTECKTIYYHFRRDHESSSFPKLTRKIGFVKKLVIFFGRGQFTLLAINGIICIMLLSVLVQQDRKFLSLDKELRKNCAAIFYAIPGFVTVLKILVM